MTDSCRGALLAGSEGQKSNSRPAMICSDNRRGNYCTDFTDFAASIPAMRPEF